MNLFVALIVLRIWHVLVARVYLLVVICSNNDEESLSEYHAKSTSVLCAHTECDS